VWKKQHRATTSVRVKGRSCGIFLVSE
jgi:hypothetical protein